MLRPFETVPCNAEQWPDHLADDRHEADSISSVLGQPLPRRSEADANAIERGAHLLCSVEHSHGASGPRKGRLFHGEATRVTNAHAVVQWTGHDQRRPPACRSHGVE